MKGAIFSTIGSLLNFSDMVALDLFAGSGALGIEALSRGASFCRFVDSDESALNAIAANLSSLGIEEGELCRADLLKQAGLSRALGGERSFDLIFADPPYGAVGRWEIANRLRSFACIKTGAMLVVETGARQLGGAEDNVEPALGVQLIKERVYGDTGVSYFAFD